MAMDGHLGAAERILASYGRPGAVWDGGLSLLADGCVAGDEGAAPVAAVMPPEAGKMASGHRAAPVAAMLLPVAGKMAQGALKAPGGESWPGIAGAGRLLLRAGLAGSREALDLAKALHGQLAGALRGENHLLPPMTGAMALEAVTAAFPFLAEYETRLGEKRNFHALFARLREMEEAWFRPGEALYDTGLPAGSREESRFRARHLAALLHIWEACDEELFEHFKTAQRLFKAAHKGLLAWRLKAGDTPADPIADRLLIYCTCKGVRLGALLADRYLPGARQLTAGLAPGGEEALDAAGLGAVLLLESEPVPEGTPA